MSNIICFNSSAPKEEWLTMSNQGTDCFLELIIKAASDIAMTESQKDLINYLIERKDVNEIAPGTVSFDIDEMPWNPRSLHEDVSYMLGIIAGILYIVFNVLAFIYSVIMFKKEGLIHNCASKS